jgi:hypothetical protein
MVKFTIWRAFTDIEVAQDIDQMSYGLFFDEEKFRQNSVIHIMQNRTENMMSRAYLVRRLYPFIPISRSHFSDPTFAIAKRYSKVETS